MKIIGIKINCLVFYFLETCGIKPVGMMYDIGHLLQTRNFKFHTSWVMFA